MRNFCETLKFVKNATWKKKSLQTAGHNLITCCLGRYIVLHSREIFFSKLTEVVYFTPTSHSLASCLMFVWYLCSVRFILELHLVAPHNWVFHFWQVAEVDIFLICKILLTIDVYLFRIKFDKHLKTKSRFLFYLHRCLYFS